MQIYRLRVRNHKLLVKNHKLVVNFQELYVESAKLRRQSHGSHVPSQKLKIKNTI